MRQPHIYSFPVTTSRHYFLFSNLSFSLPRFLSSIPRVSSETRDFMLMGSLTMEEKQLDFNRPLISIRRPTQTSETESKDSATNKNPPPPSPPVYKSDIKSGPVRNPGTVPFQWEHIPGKPKDERKPVLQGLVETHFVPKLPPGRIINCREPQEPETRDAKSYSSRYEDDDSDGTYLDANDTLSRSESFFFNCSNVSGLSGLDGPGIVVEPFGTLSSDRQTQDLMMGRFLPAAKALTSETPQNLARKPPKPEEPARQMMVMKKEKHRKAEQNPYRFQQEEDGNTSSMMASGVCGLVPQICSFGILSSVPSVRVQTQRAVSVRRMRSKYQDSTQNKQTNETVNEDKRKLKINGSTVERSSQGESLSVKENFSATKISKNFGELLASDDNTWKPVAEKTLYVDTVHSVDKNVQEESKEQSLSKEFPPLDIVPVKEDEDIIVEECSDQAIVAVQECNVVVEITKEKTDLEVKLLQRKTTNLESSRFHHRSTYHIVPPPPLPKAPSDSWLKRTLPTIPSKNNSFTWLQSLGTDNNHFTKIQANPKWETLVKTSNTEQGFMCFSKETLNPIPEA
ncbi:unnamed protein product [Microthlaspi erraticum]|uniref:Uncharacterized protein n=1 Tax=Microthlaspi erraticum TaxID=1685480 RepID=A0A6D2J8R6_9BRAS|nr:unnamed protein product [Microthlaspi erraticum]